MAAVAAYLRNILIISISAMVAAILLITGYRTRTSVVSASVVIIISHMHLPSSVGFCIRRKNRAPFGPLCVNRLKAIEKL